MTIRTDNPVTIDKTSGAFGLSTVGERHPTLLTDGELGHVAAAGSKKGLSPGADNPPPPRPK